MTARTLQLSEGLHRYLIRNSLRETAVQRKLRQHTLRVRSAGMQITPEQGQFMQLLVRLIRAKRCIEIGTYTGYSSLAVALALPPGGKIVCCDISEEWTSMAQIYWKKAGVRNKIDLRLGPALATLATLSGRFDFAFIDADKTNYANYYEHCLKLLRRGGLIAIDNTLWGGSVIDAGKQSADTRAIRAFNRKLHRDRRIDLSLVPIGDGLTLALKR